MRNATGILLLLVATGLSAQLNEQITVNVVEVPVYVARKGSSVTGLKKEDFVLTVNGKPQVIDYFDVVVNQPTMQAEATQPQQQQQQQGVDLDRRRMIVLLFDLTQTSHVSVARAKEAAAKFVHDAPRGDVFAVATMGTAGIRFAAPFLSDRVAVLRAIATLRTSKASDAFGIATLNSERSAFGSSVAADASGREPVDRIWETPNTYRGLRNSRAAAAAVREEARARQFEEEIRTTLRNMSAEHLGALADRLAPLSGIKHVVLLAENSILPLPTAQARQGIVITPLTVWDTVREVHKRFRAAGVVLDAVDLRSLSAPWSGDDRDPAFSSASSLHTLSLETGGTVATNLERLRDTQRVTYVLGFRPPGGAKSGTIGVKLRNQPIFTDLRYRRTYSTEPIARSRAAEGLFLADVLMNDIPQNGMTVNLHVKRQGDQNVITTTIPGQELLALGNGLLDLDTFIYIFDEAGQVAEWAFLESKIDLVKGRDVLTAEPYTITSRVRLEPGRYVAKVLLRAVDSDATAFARAEFVVN